jgi:hypothetical protein
MAARLYMDVHVPAAITAGLRRCGIDVPTCQEDGADRLLDDRLLERSTELGRVLFSQDNDLLALAAQCQREGVPFGGVIYAHPLSAGVGALIKDLELALSCCKDSELANGVTYLPLW